MFRNLVTRRVALRTTAIAAVLLAVGTVAAPRAGIAGATGSSGPPPPNPAIAFILTPTKGVCVMNDDGSNVRSLVRGNGWWEPSWSPDAGAIAFGRIIDLWRVNSDGSGAVMLSNPGEVIGYPAWSPLGHEIAVSSADSSQVLAYPALGGPYSVIYSAPTGSEVKGFVAWSSDGTRLAVVEHATSGSDSIKIVDRATGAVLQTLVDGVFQYINDVDWARLSEDTLAFSAAPAGQGSFRTIYVVDLATGQPQPLLAEFADNPSFSPDNTWLVYGASGTIKKIELATGRTVSLGKGHDPDWKRVP